VHGTGPTQRRHNFQNLKLKKFVGNAVGFYPPHFFLLGVQC
jgi:hypothetical protein